MKNSKPSKEELLQYIYDNSIEEACKQWQITEDIIWNIINPHRSFAPKVRTYGNKIVAIKDELNHIIANNYNKLWSRFIKDKSKLSMSQNAEDIFHNTLLKIIEELSDINEEQIVEYISYRFKTISFQTIQDQKELYKHQIYLEDAISQKSYTPEN